MPITANLIFGVVCPEPPMPCALSTELYRTGLLINFSSGKADMTLAEPAIPLRKSRRSTLIFFIKYEFPLMGRAIDYHSRQTCVSEHISTLSDRIHPQATLWP